MRDAQGRSTYVDVSGRTLASVIGEIRTFPGGDSGVAYSAWGPSDLSLLGTATFPDGSRLLYQHNQALQSAVSYDVQAASIVSAFNAAVSAGGDARSGTPECSKVTSSNSATFQVQPATLEEMAALNPGKPCIFGPFNDANGNSLDPNAWWSTPFSAGPRMRRAGDDWTQGLAHSSRPPAAGLFPSISLRPAWQATGRSFGG